MAITVTPEIDGQVANERVTYCYLYEPLEVRIRVGAGANKIFIDLSLDMTFDRETPDDIVTAYAEYDVDPLNNTIKVDLMELVRQYHNPNVYTLGHVEQLRWAQSLPIGASFGNNRQIVSWVVYNFSIYSDLSSDVPVTVQKLPIIGGRGFRDFTPNVDSTNKLSEFDVLGLNLENRWKGYPVIKSQLANLSGTPQPNTCMPTTEVIMQTNGKKPCGGFIVWKSKLGGWCYWGFDIRTERISHSYEGSIENSSIQASVMANYQRPFDYIPAMGVNYTGMSTSYSYTLKSLALTRDELKAVSGISESPAVYYVHEDGRMELMRLQSATVPMNTTNNGGDFQVSLKSISKVEQKTR